MMSLETLCDKFLNVQLDKFFQVADWRIRPLPQGMMDYARCDSHYLIPLYAIFQQILMGNIHAVWLREDVQQGEEWVTVMKTLSSKKQKMASKLEELARLTNEFTIDKVLKTNNQRVQIYIKN